MDDYDDIDDLDSTYYEHIFDDSEEEFHFFSVVSDFLDLVDLYTAPVVMSALKQMRDKDETTLTSIN